MFKTFIAWFFYFLIFVRSQVLIIQKFDTDTFTIDSLDQLGLSQPNQIDILPFTSTTTCGSITLVGGFEVLGNGYSLNQIIPLLPTHYEVTISVEVYLFNTLLPLSELFQVSFGGINDSPGVFTDLTDYNNILLCGTQAVSSIWGYSITIPHSDPNLEITLSTLFSDDNSQLSWGIRSLIITIKGDCDPTCLTCNLNAPNVCISCINGDQPSDTNDVCLLSTEANSEICNVEIQQYSQLLMYDKECSLSTDSITHENHVLIDISVDFQKAIGMSADCQASLVPTLYYYDPKTQGILHFPSEYITFTENGGLEVEFPLIQIENYAIKALATASTESTFKILFILVEGNDNYKTAQHQFELYIVIDNTVQLNVLLDVNPQETEENCEEGSDTCNTTIVQDLDIEGALCEDSQCSTIITDVSSKKFYISSTMIVRLRFKDRSYTKMLTLNRLFFRSDTSVFDQTQTTRVLANDNKGTIILEVRLSYIAQSALFQFNMLIGQSPSNTRNLGIKNIRNLEEQTQANKNSFQMKLTILENPSQNNVTTISISSSRMIQLNILFIFAYLLF